MLVVMQQHSRAYPIRFTWLFALAALSLMTGCDRGEPKGVLRFAHFWSEPAQRSAMDSLLAGFHREHPEISIEVTELSWADGKTKLMIGFNSNTAPDVLELGSDWVAQFSASGVLQALDSGATAARFRERLAAASSYAVPSGSWAGRPYALPWMLDTRVLYMNRDRLLKAGIADSIVTSNRLDLATLRSLARAPGVGIAVNGPDQHRLYKKVLPYVWSFGGDLFGPRGEPTMERPENVQALEYYVDQLNGGQLGSQKELDEAFVRGSLGFCYSGSWLLPRLSKASFRWSTVRFPGSVPGAGYSFAGGEYLAMNASSAMKPQAAVFLEYMTRPENELRFARAVNMFPADVPSQRDTFYQHRREGSVFSEQLAHAKMTPVIPQWLDIEAIIEDEVSKALYHTETPREALHQMQLRSVRRMAEP